MTTTSLEYLITLGLLAAAGLSLFWDQLKVLTKSSAFWIGQVAYLITSCIIEWAGLHWDWWVFSEERLIGWAILGIPIEELVLFSTAYTFTICIWEAVNR